MTRISKIVIASVVALAFFGDGARAKADHDIYSRIDQLAVDIKVKSDLLIDETKHYRATPNYGQLVGGAYRLRGLAQSTCILAQHSGNIYALEANLKQLDSVFHYLEDAFDEAEFAASHGHGRIRGNTAHVKELLCAIEECICKMRDDVAALRRPSTCVRRPYSGYGGYGGGCDLSRSYGSGHRYDYGRYYGSYSGLSFGNDNIRFRIKF